MKIECLVNICSQHPNKMSISICLYLHPFQLILNAEAVKLGNDVV